MREIVFDTETTGLSPAGGDRMVEIGCIEMVGRVETGRHFHCYFNPDRPMPSEAEAVHGLSDIFLSDKPRFADKVEELLEFIGAALAIGAAPGVIRGINRRLPLVVGVSGGVMVAMGAIMTLGIYQQFFARLVALSPWTPWEPSL